MRRFSSRKNLLGMERWRLIVISRSKTIRGRVSLKELGRIIKSYPFDASCRSRRLVLGRKGRLVLAREIRLEMQVKGCLDIRVKDCLIAFLRRQKKVGMIPAMNPLGKITGVEVKHLYYSFNQNYETTCEMNFEFFSILVYIGIWMWQSVKESLTIPECNY